MMQKGFTPFPKWHGDKSVYSYGKKKDRGRKSRLSYVPSQRSSSEISHLKHLFSNPDHSLVSNRYDFGKL